MSTTTAESSAPVKKDSVKAPRRAGAGVRTPWPAPSSRTAC